MSWRLTVRILKVFAVCCAGVALLTCRAACALDSGPFVDPVGADEAGRVLSSQYVGFGSPAPDGGKTSLLGRMLLPYRVEYEYTFRGVRYTGSGATLDDPRDAPLDVAVSSVDPADSRVGPLIDLYLNLGSFAAAGVTFALAGIAGWAGRRFARSAE
jgi:hypothetical protein